MIFTRKSIITGIVRDVDLNVTQEQYDRFESGWYVQDAFPHLSDDEREFIISGMTADEFKDYILESFPGKVQNTIFVPKGILGKIGTLS